MSLFESLIWHKLCQIYSWLPLIVLLNWFALLLIHLSRTWLQVLMMSLSTRKNIFHKLFGASHGTPRILRPKIILNFANFYFVPNCLGPKLWAKHTLVTNIRRLCCHTICKAMKLLIYHQHPTIFINMD